MGNGNIHKIKILLASLVTVIAAMADVYIIVNAPKNYILLGVTSVVLLVGVYLVISGKMQLRDWNNLKVEEQYDNLITSQKACYLQVKKSFRETGGKINELDKKIDPLATAGEVNHKKISGLLDALMEDQKKVAKLTVSRSKENANAMMNSNDKVIEEMSKMQEAMNGIVQQNSDKKENNQSEEFVKLEERQQELLEKMQNLEDSIKSQLETVADKIQEMPKLEREGISEGKTELGAESKDSFETEALEETMIEIQPEAEELDLAMEEAGTEEPEPIAEEATEEEDTQIEPDLILEEAVLEGPEPIAEEAMEETDTQIEPDLILEEEDTQIEPDLVLEEEDTQIEAEPMVEESVIEESPLEKSAVPETNKMLTPEEIAALIAGNKEEPVTEETAPEEPVVQENAGIPDLSDPNKKMSPEDIAALIANM